VNCFLEFYYQTFVVCEYNIAQCRRWLPQPRRQHSGLHVRIFGQRAQTCHVQVLQDLPRHAVACALTRCMPVLAHTIPKLWHVPNRTSPCTFPKCNCGDCVDVRNGCAHIRPTYYGCGPLVKGSVLVVVHFILVIRQVQGRALSPMSGRAKPSRQGAVRSMSPTKYLAHDGQVHTTDIRLKIRVFVNISHITTHPTTQHNNPSK
jgi:hypothetical protein